MKTKYLNLISQREPFEYVERAMIYIKDGMVVSFTEETGETNLPVASMHMLYLGPGCSISHEAAIMCAKHDCYIAFSKGGLNVHSVWHSGRWKNPEFLVKQVLTQKFHKLEAAKKLAIKRGLDKEKIKNCGSIEELLGIEASFAKREYAILSEKFGVYFKRDQKSKEGVNSYITILNNLLYNYISSIIYAVGYSPSIGFIHGYKRRGGLVFDIADLYKKRLVLDPAFETLQFKKKPSNQKMMRDLSERLKMDRGKMVKEIISILKEICDSDNYK